MKPLMVSLGLVCLVLFGASKASAVDEKTNALFAADAIEPSEMTYFLIDRLFRGRMSPVPPAYQQELDRALISGDWQRVENGILALENDVGMEAALNWQATRHVAGYLAISLRYALYSFAIGDAYDRNKLKEFSVIAWFYILAAIRTDGYKCADWSAPRAFLGKIQSRFAEIRAFASSLPQERLEQFQVLALYLEEGIAPDRAADPMLCSYGMPPFPSSSGDQKRPTREASIDDQEVNPGDGWLDDAAETRASLPETMKQILAILKG